ncbi:MAG: hypothetical protein ACRYG7_16100 [Janthinobacterium lividum]
MNTTSKLTNDILDLTLTGDLTGSLDTDQLLCSVDKYFGNVTINCAVDLFGIYYLNSSSIGVLVALLTKFCSCGGEMVLNKLNNIFAVAAIARQRLTIAAS